MEGRVKVYDCKDYFIMQDMIDKGYLAYENNGIFITASHGETLEQFREKVEEILEKGY